MRSILRGRQFTGWHFWSLEGPLHKMPREMVLALGERLVVMVERGLS